MSQQEKIIHTIFSAIEDINQQLPKERRLETSTDTILFGESGKLDSLGLINLIVALEEKIEEELGASIILTDGQVMDLAQSVFKTVKSLADYIALSLNEG